MNPILKFSLLAAALVLPGAGALAQDKIYRCGNEYINNANEARTRNCKLVEGGNVTVVQGGSGIPGSAVPPASAPVRSPGASAAPAGSPRVEAGDQRARDGEARSILESELKKAETKQQQLVKDYNNGEPEKMGIEGRNYARYQERVGEMKASIARNEADIAGIKRELSRLPASKQ